MSLQLLTLIIVVFIGVVSSVWTGKLTVAGALAGGVMGIFLFVGAGWTGLLLMASFFILGTAATSWKRNKKEILHTAEEQKGRRTASQVLANGGVGGLLGLLAWLYPEQKDVFQFMMAAAFSSATADTLSSELGSVYGKKFYNIISFKKDKRGLDGVISIEGMFFGLAASVIIAAIYSTGFGWTQKFLWIVLAGTIGNLSDSVMGALWERRHLLHNDVVNFLNTAIAALVCFLA